MEKKIIQTILRVLIAGAGAFVGNLIMHAVFRIDNHDLALLSWNDTVVSIMNAMIIMAFCKDLIIPRKWLTVAASGFGFGLMYTFIILLIG